MKRLLGLALLALTAFTASAQTVPNGGLSQGQIWTQGQWITAWQSKVDTTSGMLLNPVLVGPTLGTPLSGNLVNTTGYLFSNVAGGTTAAALFIGTGGSLSSSGGPIAATTVPASGIIGICTIAQGCTGTATPALTQGSGITITGTYPNYTISASGSSGGATSIATANGFAGSVTGATATISTSITGVAVGNGTSLASAGCSPSQLIGGTGGCTTPGGVLGALVVVPTGVAATDLANLQAAFSTLALSVRTPTGFSQAAPIWNVQIAPGTLNITSCGTNILGSSTTKTQGIWIQGSGRGVTVLYFNPTSGGCPLFVNNHGLDVKFTDMTNVGGSACPDWMWSQEQAGITNIQDDTTQDVEWQGCWKNGERLTGGNNNSEQKFSRITVAGTMGTFLYTPPQVTTTITSGTTTLAATINNEEVESGDTGFFPTACGTFAANTQYYVRPGATTSSYTLSATSGGSAITPTATCTVAFQTGNDQFLNFWIDSMKFDTGTSQSQIINMAYGGSIHITNLDVSGYAPASAGSCLFTLGTNVNNGVHNGGVENFSVDHFRIEISSNNVCVMNDNWWRGTVSWNNRDESSQAGNRTISNIYDTYNFTQNGGPTVDYQNFQMMGKHAYVVGSNDYTYQRVVHYRTITLLDNPSFANAIAMSGTNTGGYPLIKCDDCKNNLVSSTVGYQEIVDTCLNWQYSNSGTCLPKSVPCLGAQSNWPISSGALTWRFPLNAAILQNYWWKAAGSSNTGAYSYTFQTTEATPTVLGGPYTGTASGSAIARQTAYGANGSTEATTSPFVMSTDLARTIQIVDNQGRSGAFGSGLYCVIEYIGDNLNILAPANDSEFYDAMRKVA